MFSREDDLISQMNALCVEVVNDHTFTGSDGRSVTVKSMKDYTLTLATHEGDVVIPNAQLVLKPHWEVAIYSSGGLHTVLRCSAYQISAEYEFFALTRNSIPIRGRAWYEPEDEVFMLVLEGGKKVRVSGRHISISNVKEDDPELVYK